VTCALCGAPDADEGALCPACDRLSSFFTETMSHEREATGPVAPGALATPAFAPGHSFGDRYTIVELVGSGGMGQVYKAIDRGLNRTVALKLIRPGLQTRIGALQRFRRELSLARQVTHPNVCRVHDLGEVEGTLYISMEFVTGQALEDLMRSVGHLSPRQTIAMGRQICAGLAAVHERQIVHRDMKPSNVMVDRAGHAVLMDFGMAYHAGDEKLTSEGSVLGTLAYLSPEHARGQTVDVRSDIYALGVILYEMLTGRRPPGDDGPLPLALRESGERCPPPSHFVPEVPVALDAVVLRCLERDPARRFPTAVDLEQALAQSASSLSTVLMAAPPPEPPRPPPWRRRVVVGAGALGLLAAGLALSRLWPGPPPPTAVTKVAVLTLEYEGPRDSAYLKDVVPLVIGEALRGASGVEVAPFASSRGFRPQEDAPSVARQLGVGYVLAGRVDVTGQESRIALTLTAADGKVAWEDRRSAAPAALLGEADPVAAAVLRALGHRPPVHRGPSRSARALELYLQGQTFLEGWDVARNYARAEESFRSAVTADEGFAPAHAGLALALWRLYRETKDPRLVEQAQTQAERAIALAPSLPESHLALGVVRLARGRSVEAAGAFQKAEELAPADDNVCRQIANAYGTLDRPEEAERMYQRAIELRPGYWENYNDKGVHYLRTGELAAAKGMFGKVIQLRADSDTGYLNQATAHLWAGEFAAAEPLLLTALRLNPTPQAHTNLGFVYYTLGRYEEAAREFHAATESGATGAEAFGSLGDAYRQMGRLREAREAYARAIELAEERLRVNPRDATMRSVLAMFLAGSGRCPDARRELREVAGTGSSDVQYYAAVACAICGDRAEAVGHAVKALESGSVADLRTNPDLKGVRNDPAVRRLMK
jgi:Flp pilus assembly protein TadD/TolB-like protein